LKSLINRNLVRFKFFLTRINILKIKGKYNVNWNSKNGKNVSISDNFLWRTDNGFSTIFKYTDILGVFYGISKTLIEIEIYDQHAKLINVVTLEENKKVNSFIIDEKLVGYEGYGFFNIYHIPKSNQNEKISILNRCYIGFMKNNSISMVHGNSIVKGKQFKNRKIQNNYVNSSSLVNKVYKIQKKFDEYDRVELFFANPIKKKVIIKINDFQTKIGSHAIYKHNLRGVSFIETVSNCNFLRPTIFTYKNDFFDVLHS